MTRAERIKFALDAADAAMLITSPAEASRAAKAWSRAKVLGLDTEFVRERTFYANIGLVQISDGHTVWLVDPLVEGMNAPLRDLLENPDIAKLIHSPSEDLDVLNYAIGALPTPMIDTQLACAYLGQPVQSGYHTAAEWLLDVPIEKDQTRSNWVARPLKAVQLKYAALDVCLLPLMWEMLNERLQELDRLDWFEEDCTKQLEKAGSEDDPAIFWKRIRGIGRLDGQSLAILQALTKWREQEARNRNLPRGFVVHDNALLNISRHKIQVIDELSNIDELHSRTIERHGAKLIEQVEQTLSSGLVLDTVDDLTPRQRKLLSEMRGIVKSTAVQLGLEPTLLASKKDLEALILEGTDEWPIKLEGWRRELFGDALLKKLEKTV